ncbi:MAG: hypothetical protein LBG60_00330 [Bifidobacteriaceae bacterium]|nr:hypothetical protein [Bifidobacteriaceae bacterium]
MAVAIALFIGWLIIKIGSLTDWWEGLIPLVWNEYTASGGRTFLSFISPLMLWLCGLLALGGIGSFLPDDEDGQKDK